MTEENEVELHEPKLHYSLDYLLDNSDLIIIDSSLKCEEDFWYERDVYEAKYFSDMDTAKLQIVEKGGKKYRDLFEYSKVMTISKVVEQLEQWKNILHQKLVMLNTFQRNRKTSPKYKKQSSKVSTRKLRDEDSLQKKIFEEVCFDYKEVARLARKSTIKPKHPEKFSILEKIVTAVRDVTHFEHIRSRYEEPLLKERELISADEQIVAAALYLSIFENRSPVILTGDSDVARLYHRTTSCLFNEATPFSDFFIDTIGKDHPMKLFFEIGDKIMKSGDSSKICTEFYWDKLHPAVDKVKDSLLPGIKEYVVELMTGYDFSHWEAQVQKDLNSKDDEKINPYLLS